MPRPNPADYAWLVHTEYAEAGCLTVVVGMDVQTCLKVIGAEDAPVTDTFSRDASGASLVSVLPAGDGDAATAVLVEQNGFEGSRTEVLRRLSKKGRAASAFWNVNGAVRFGCAQRGKVVASAELDDPDDDELPARLRRIVDEFRDSPDQPALAMALVQQFTGVAVAGTAEVMAPGAAHRILEPISQLPVTPEELVRLQLPAASLVADVMSASSSARWLLAEWAAEQAVEAAALREQPAVAAFLDQPTTPRTMTPELSALRSAADRLLWSLSLAINSPEGTDEDTLNVGPAGSRRWALECLAYLAQPDEVAAALGASYCANLVAGAGDSDSAFVSAAREKLTALD